MFNEISGVAVFMALGWGLAVYGWVKAVAYEHRIKELQKLIDQLTEHLRRRGNP